MGTDGLLGYVEFVIRTTNDKENLNLSFSNCDFTKEYFSDKITEKLGREHDLQCPDNFDEIKFTGGNVSQLTLEMYRCQGKEYCKSDEEINTFLENKELMF